MIKETKKSKIALKLLAVMLCVITLFASTTTAASAIGWNPNVKTANTFEKVQYENQLVPKKNENGDWTFTTDREFKILQLTDVHIGGGWMSIRKDKMALNAVAAMVTAEKPDLVIVTGDVAYPVPFQAGTFNNKKGAEVFATLMEKLGVYWTLGFGNHDTEAYSFYNREKISKFYTDEKFTYCLYTPGPANVDGFGNQQINIENTKGIVTQSLFVFDSHSYTDNDWFGIMWKYDNIHENQVQWYKNCVKKTNAKNDAIFSEAGIDRKSDVKSLAFFHIPLVEMKNAWDEYAANGYKDTENVKLIYGVAGETDKVVYCGMHEDSLFETMQELGSTKGVFFGHDHKNNLSFNYKGIRLTYSYAVDYLAYPGIHKLGAQRGCTVITVSPDGEFKCKAENYYQDKYVPLYEKEKVEMQEVTYAAAK